MANTTARDLLKLINGCDNFPLAPSPEHTAAVSEYWLFALLDDWTAECTKLNTHGYTPAFVVKDMPWTSDFKLDHTNKIISIPFHEQKSESEILAHQLQIAREAKIFKALASWRDELLPVLGLKNRLVDMERVGTGLFGIAARGVHCTAYMRTSEGELKLIIARRSAKKSSWPNMLDNTIAGAQSSSESPWLAYIREGEEETGLPPSVTSRAIPTSSISYVSVRKPRAGGGESGLCRPEMQFCYDLELHEGETPRPNDYEVAGFEIMSLQQAWDCLVRDEFKENCGLVLIDFLVRWGFIRAGPDRWITKAEDVLPCQREGWEVSAEDYTEIVARLHRKHVFESVDARLGRLANAGGY